MTPEERARKEIDRRLVEAGWMVQDYAGMNIRAAEGIAVREFPLRKGHGTVDYMLYANGKAIGSVEAKPEGHTLRGVETQSGKYAAGLKDSTAAYEPEILFGYESTGVITQFTNTLEPDARSREVFQFHRPGELVRLARRDEQTLAALRAMPPLPEEGLWPAQVRAIQGLERSLAENRPRSLVQMATGSGKTFTAVSLAYRLIKFAGAKRILFLVDRKNLGNQTVREFQQYASPQTGRLFTEEYNVQHLHSNAVDPVSRVVVTTVQRLYSMLKGEPYYEEEREEGSMFEAEPQAAGAPLPVVYNPSIPVEAFDFIIVDECHRSIYNLWRQVLEYFDASLIGLTATPSKHTIGFFKSNLVTEYDHAEAVADGVNVGHEVYRIRTRVTGGGATLEKDPAYLVPRRDRRTRSRRYAALDEDLAYTANRLDRDVVNEAQIRLVVKTFKERLFSEIFPGRTEVPKTLVFAKNDSHADDVTEIIREEFGKGNQFCQKITYRTTGKKPEELLQEFRNDYHPRIAVSVDMIATGTDVKPLECLIFIRDVKSANYFEQMKGRGSRVIGVDDLRGVTPDAEAKTRFVIVDAIGLTEHDRTESQPLDRKRSVPVERLLQAVAEGSTDPDVVSTLAARLAALDLRLGDEDRKEISSVGGKGLKNLAHDLLGSLDPDAQERRAVEISGLAEGEEPTEEQIDEAEEAMIVEALSPLYDPRLRQKILDVKSSFEQVIDETTPDELLSAGYDEATAEKARDLVGGFERFVRENREE
ncbi:MAG: DEAD/DEAH box helicase family protein, partial [Actinomycetota bacterium]|nr:DEAD/DEAH box helicase family protein [Actinomycetota bacterium]